MISVLMIRSKSIDDLILVGEADDHGNEYGKPGTHGCRSLSGQEDIRTIDIVRWISI